MSVEDAVIANVMLYIDILSRPQLTDFDKNLLMQIIEDLKTFGEQK